MSKRASDYSEEQLLAYRQNADAFVERCAYLAGVELTRLRNREARKDVQPPKPNDPTNRRKRAARLAMKVLYHCSEVLDRPPPFEVVELLAYLLDVPPNPALPLHDRSESHHQAARYLVAHPEASNREVAKKVGVSHQTIKKWKSGLAFMLLQSHYSSSDQEPDPWAGHVRTGGH